jgi:phosphate-selective porin OprO/OprP
MKTKLLAISVAVSFLMLGTVSAQEENSTMESLLEHIKHLENRIVELETTRVEDPVTDLEKQINVLGTNALAGDNDFTVSWGKSRKFATSDKTFQLTTGGRIMNDWIFGTQDDDYEDAIVGDATNAPLGKLQDGTEFRRARLYTKGVLYDNIVFKLDFGFEGGDADFKDAYIGIKNVAHLGTILVGQMKIPFGLEYMASSRFITFNERSMGNDAFIADRGTGIRVNNTAFEGDRLAWYVAIYREADTFGDSALKDGQYNFAARVSGLPWYEEDGKKLLHLGVGVNWRNPSQAKSGASRFRFRSQPETHLGPRVVDTDNFEADSAFLWNAEIALVLHSFSVQGELFYAMVDSDTANDPNFYGFNVQVSYFLTGEHRPYKKSAGAFDRVKVKNNFMNGEGGAGAWELATRFSMIDLNDGNIEGGEAWTLTGAVTWYLNPSTQVKLNYIYANVDNTVGGSQEGQAHIITLRFQIDF